MPGRQTRGWPGRARPCRQKRRVSSRAGRLQAGEELHGAILPFGGGVPALREYHPRSISGGASRARAPGRRPEYIPPPPRLLRKGGQGLLPIRRRWPKVNQWLPQPAVIHLLWLPRHAGGPNRYGFLGASAAPAQSHLPEEGLSSSVSAEPEP